MGKRSFIFMRRLVCYFQVVIQDLNCVINMVKSELDFIFTTIDKLFLLISFVGMDVSAKGVIDVGGSHSTQREATGPRWQPPYPMRSESSVHYITRIPKNSHKLKNWKLFHR